MQLQEVDTKRDALVKDISDLKKEAARLNTPSTYAKCAKCQRQVNAKEKQLSVLGEATGGSAWQDKVVRLSMILKASKGQ